MEVSHEEKSAWARRYSRQMLVPQFGGVQGQALLSNCKILVVGAGGIGSTVIMYLAGAGIGRIDILDFDIVEESNLHRQIIHTQEGADSKQFKAESACQRVRSLNPQITTNPLIYRLTSENARELLQGYDVIVDATDNYEARYAVNDACVALGIPLVSGSAVGIEGQVTVFPCDRISPCYRCLYPSPSAVEGCRSCANAGVLGPVPGLIGTLQAMEVIKLITSRNPSKLRKDVSLLIGRQVYYDGSTGDFHTFSLPPRRVACGTCGDIGASQTPPILSPSLPGLPDIPEANRTSTSQYYELLRAGVTHVLLDVRSQLQFNMISLHIEKYSTDPTCCRYLNIPYASLNASQSKDTVLLASQAGVDGNNLLPIYVLCRRGNDSVRATACLLEVYPDLKIFNIDGGLSSWSKTIDSTFPLY